MAGLCWLVNGRGATHCIGSLCHVTRVAIDDWLPWQLSATHNSFALDPEFLHPFLGPFPQLLLFFRLPPPFHPSKSPNQPPNLKKKKIFNPKYPKSYPVRTHQIAVNYQNDPIKSWLKTSNLNDPIPPASSPSWPRLQASKSSKITKNHEYPK